MLSKPKKTIYVATTAELMNEHYYRRLWIAIRNLSEQVPISRREWLNVLADCFRDTYDVEILLRSGKPYCIPCVDEAFGDDPDNRWFSDFLKSDPAGTRPRAKSRKLERVQLLDLYCRLRHPNVARHFGR